MPFDPSTATLVASQGAFDPSTAKIVDSGSSASLPPTIGQSVGGVEPYMQAPQGETDFQAVHRLEPYVLGHGLDAKGNAISPEDQEAATDLWKQHYKRDVEANGAGFTRGASNLGSGLKNAAVNAGEATAGFLEHPVDNTLSGLSKAGDAVAGLFEHPISSTAQGVATGVTDIAHAGVNLGAGAFEQSQAHASYHNPSNAEFAADTALARLKFNDQYNTATTPDNPTPGFGTARVAGQIAGAELTAPGAAQKVISTAGNAGEAIIPPIINAAGKVAAAPFRLAGWAANAAGTKVPGLGQVATAISDATSTSKAAAAASDASELARAQAALQDHPALNSIALQRVGNAEQAVQDATVAGTPAEGLTPLIKEAQDAHQELAKLNMGAVAARHIVSTAADAAKPSMLQNVLASVGRVTGKSTAGGALGGTYGALTGNPGDPDATTRGAVGGIEAGGLAGLSGEAMATNLGRTVQAGATNLGTGALRVVSNGYLGSIGYLKALGGAVQNAYSKLASSIPTTLPEDDNFTFPQSKAVEMAKEDLANKSGSGESEKPQPPENSGKTTDGKGNTVFTVGTEEKASASSTESKPGPPLAAPSPAPQAGPKIEIDPIVDHPYPQTAPSAREVKVLAGDTVPVSEGGDVPFSPKLPGQHEKINFLKRQLPTEFNPATHGIQGAGPTDEDIYKLAGGLQPAASSKITGIAYDPAKQLLGVGMNDGKFYVHSEVPQELADKFSQEAELARSQAALPKSQRTASVGKLYNQTILGNPDYRYITIRTPLLDETGNPLPEIKAAAEQIRAHDERQASLQSALSNNYDTAENIAQRSAAEKAEHDIKLKGILAGSQEGPNGPLSPPASKKLPTMRGNAKSAQLKNKPPTSP